MFSATRFSYYTWSPTFLVVIIHWVHDGKVTKKLHNVYLYVFVDASVLKMDALKNFKVFTSGPPMPFSACGAFTTAVHYLQPPTAIRRSKTILDVKSNMAGELEMLEYKARDASVCNKPRNTVGTSAILSNKIGLERPKRARISAVKRRDVQMQD